MNNETPSINVVAAAIGRTGANGQTEYFTAQRDHGELKGFYEFPGGKIEGGETAEDAVRREIREELKAEIEVGELIDTIDYDYPTFHLHMQVFACRLISDSITLTEHLNAKWITVDDLDGIMFAPADGIVAEVIRRKEVAGNDEA